MLIDLGPVLGSLSPLLTLPPSFPCIRIRVVPSRPVPRPQELKSALRKLKEAASRAKGEEAAMLGRAASFQTRAETARAAVQSMERLEQAKRDLEDCKKGKMVIRDRVGVVLADKGMKSTVNECVRRAD